MALVTNKRIILKEYSTGLPVPGQTTSLGASQTIDLDNVPLNGGMLLKILVLSLEPFVIFMTRSTSIPGAPRIGESIVGYGIAVVVRSENPAFQIGDHVYGLYPFQEYTVRHDHAGSITRIDNEYNLPWSVFLGVAGMPGKTAYYGWKDYSQAKKGEVAFISSGAGAVGSLVIQLAKRDGMKVIASAGSDDKVEFMKELGADVAFNYKTTRTSEILEKEGPINVYWDNVGGETLEAALNAAAVHARFIECGMISEYNEPKPILNLFLTITKQITLFGFNISHFPRKYQETFQQEIPALLAKNELKYRENITRGLENAEVALDDFLKGAFIGKSVVVVADE